MITLMAAALPVPFCRHLTTWPKVPLPSTSRTSYSPDVPSSDTRISLTLMMRSEFSLSWPSLPAGSDGLVRLLRGLRLLVYPNPGLHFLYESLRYTEARAVTCIDGRAG